MAVRRWPGLSGAVELSGSGKKLDRFDIAKRSHARSRPPRDVEAGVFTVHAVDTKPATRNPYPPFTTSTLQQEAARKLGFTASHTMRVAQGLYEEGRITYMRTDGVQIAGEAISAHPRRHRAGLWQRRRCAARHAAPLCHQGQERPGSA